MQNLLSNQFNVTHKRLFWSCPLLILRWSILIGKEIRYRKKLLVEAATLHMTLQLNWKWQEFGSIYLGFILFLKVEQNGKRKFWQEFGMRLMDWLILLFRQPPSTWPSNWTESEIVTIFVCLKFCGALISPVQLVYLCRFVFEGIDEGSLNRTLERAFRYYRESKLSLFWPLII